MQRVIITYTRPSLDIPWFYESSQENLTHYQNFINFVNGLLGDRHVVGSGQDQLTAITSVTYSSEEMEYINVMLYNTLGTYYNDYQIFLNYNDSVGIITDYEFYDSI